jgi:aryl-alcohol dehydrogenase-like predicted oxidoreductase
MQRRCFGDSDLEVSAISLGCWPFGVDWWGHYTDEQALKLMHFALDQGITFFDTGDAYGNGRAEVLVGKFIQEVGRDRIEIGTKFGYDFYNDPGEHGSHRERKQDFSPAFIRKAFDESLRRLGTDRVDLYMAHNIKLPQFHDDVFAELVRLHEHGKIRAWGVSLGPAIGWREEGIEAMTAHSAKAVQTVFNLFEQDPGREFCQVATACHGGVLARVHDNSSILKDTVKLDTAIGPADHRKFRDQSWKVFGLKKLELVRHYAADHGMTVHQLACKWLLSYPSLTSITGTLLNEHEVREAAESCDKPELTSAELRQIQADYAQDWALGPEAHPCDLKSSTNPQGKVRSSYVPPPVLIA